MLELGGTGILMQGGLASDLRIEYYQNLLRSIKQRYPRVHLHCFSAPEIPQYRRGLRLTLRDTIARLKTLASIPSPVAAPKSSTTKFAHAISRLKCTSDEWEEMHRTAHSLGLAHYRHDDVRLR